MSVKLRITPEARDDIVATMQYDGGCRRGLDEEFENEVLRVLEMIENNPLLFGVVELGVRAATTNRFPYVVYYHIDLLGVEILAVIHGARSPTAWKRRL